MKAVQFFIVMAFLAFPAAACDLCSIYSASQAMGRRGKGFFAGVAEQFTYFGTLQDNGHAVPNPVGQRMESSISQLGLGYYFNDRFDLQFNTPLIYRSFRRPEGFAIDSGTVSGLGDVVLASHFTLLDRETTATTLAWKVLGGVKFPTGNADRLAEEFNEISVPGAPQSGIHGHDLALGSGSYDGLVGTSVFGRWHRSFLSGQVQYAIRSEGDFSYRYANELIWAGGPGYFLALGDKYSISLMMNISGEWKGLDTFQGTKVADTGITSVFMGPQFAFTWTQKLGVELGVDLPISIKNTALQVVPDYRVRASLTWHF